VTTTDELVLRIEQLERSNNRLRRCFIAITLGAAIIVLMGTAAPKQQVPPAIEAQKFVLKDAAGNERGSLFATDAAWGLVLFNSDSSKGVGLVSSTYGNSFMLDDPNGKSGIFMYVNGDERNLAIFDGTTPTARMELKNTPKGSAFGLRDEKGTDRVDVALGPPYGGGIAISDANSITRTVLVEDEPSLVTFDAKGSFQWAAGLDGFDKDSQKRIRVAANSLARAKSGH
jgi:hypothetical protein